MLRVLKILKFDFKNKPNLISIKNKHFEKIQYKLDNCSAFITQ